MASLQQRFINHRYQVLELLQRGARDYYRQPSSKCTTWSYFVPFPSSKKADAPLVVGGLEIYTEKQALQKQIDDPIFFQAYHETAKKEALYAKEEELVAWYFTAGFIAREQDAKPFGGNLISLSRFVGDREGILKALEYIVQCPVQMTSNVLIYIVGLSCLSSETRSLMSSHMLPFLDPRRLRSYYSSSDTRTRKL